MNILQQLQSGAQLSDASFDAIFPQSMARTVEFHFTPLEVAKVAAEFLTNTPDAKILDIGAGAGKFCLIGAATTNGQFTGVEIRTTLHAVAQDLKADFQLAQVNFLHNNITDIDFSNYTAFYHFNAFYEHLDPSGEIDDSMPLDKSLFKTYSLYVKHQLSLMPVGTRLATYFSYGDEIPEDYKIISKVFDGKLVLREKKSEV